MLSVLFHEANLIVNSQNITSAQLQPSCANNYNIQHEEKCIEFRIKEAAVSVLSIEISHPPSRNVSTSASGVESKRITVMYGVIIIEY